MDWNGVYLSLVEVKQVRNVYIAHFMYNIMQRGKDKVLIEVWLIVIAIIFVFMILFLGFFSEFFGGKVTKRGTPKLSVCIPDCSQKSCGDDGCGGSCGECSVTANICSDLGSDFKKNVVFVKRANPTQGFLTIEGQPIRKNDYVVVRPDRGRILRLVNLPSNSSSVNKIIFTDIVSTEVFNFMTGKGQVASGKIDGEIFHVKVNNDETIPFNERSAVLTWGEESGPEEVGKQRDSFNCNV